MADARGEYWYLEPGVDATKITVPELRSILLKHGVHYPSSAKKPDLVKLFNDAVAPQAAEVRRTYARTKRSTRGIQDVPSSSASTVTTDDTEDDTLLAPQPSAARRTTRRATRAETEESDVPAPRAKTPSRAVPAKHSRAADSLDAEEPPAARRVRKSMAPAVKEPTPDPEAWHRPAADSPFTQENPFQSGSSPTAPDTATRDRRRRTTAFEQKERRKSEVNRRRTFHPQSEQLDHGVTVPTRDDFDPDIKHDGFEASEEFTPEEQLELVRERAKAGELDILPPRRTRRPKATGTLKAMSGTLLLTVAAVLGGAWRQEKLAVGFCGMGREATSLAGVEVPEWAHHVLPQCEPCPPHAQCFRGLSLSCDRDFVRKEHRLSLNGLIPIPPSCEPDTAKTRQINSVADRGVQILRQRRAKYECGEADAEGALVTSPELSQEDIKKQMAAEKRNSMSDQEFNDLFDRAFPEMEIRDEVVASTDGTTGGKLVASSSLAELSLACSVRRSVRRSLERYLLQIVMMVFVVATGSYGKYHYTTSRAMETRAKQLAGNVFDRLANHAALSMQEPGAYPDKGVSMTQLRDDVLRTEFSTSRRQKLWERVQKKVEFNSNVRAAVRTTANGDVGRIWEWIGPVKLLEDGRSSGRRESGRFSFGMGSSPPGPVGELTPKWEEGRPMY
ncbi:inner nuclear membrane protein enriched at telomere/subtelomere region [Pleosporales sp. CAS-2024a]